MTGRDIKSNLKSALVDMLSALGENVQREGLTDTPRRYIKQIEESLCGYNDNPTTYIKLFKNNDHNSLVTVSQISFSSMCEHHLLPFFGHIDIAYLPTNHILGLSKFARIVDTYSKRLQVQERLTNEIALFLNEQLKPELVMVRVRAKHTCMITRGVSRPESFTDTCSVIGDTTKHRHHVDAFNGLSHKWIE